MVLVALHRMGASDDRLEAYCAIYNDMNHLAPVPARIGDVTPPNWREFLGQREREGDYRMFFAGEVARPWRGGSRHPLSSRGLPRICGQRAARLHADGLRDAHR